MREAEEAAIKPSLMLVDGHYFLHRVMHLDSFTIMRTRSGRKTGGVYGVITSIRSSLERFPTVRRCVITWDTDRSRRRLSLCPEYKANRDPKSEREAAEQREYYSMLDDQLDLLQANIQKLGIRQVLLDGREGDDILGWTARESDSETVIATEDKDMLQLVNETTHVYQPLKEVLVTLENFREVTGCRKELFLLSKALEGDKSDNISGIPQVGKTTVDKIIDRANLVLDSYEKQRTDSDSCLMGPSQLNLGAICEDLQETDSRSRKRYQRVMEGGDIIERNLELMDLTKEVLDEGEEAVLRLLITGTPVRFDDVGTRNFFGEMEFASLLRNFHHSTEPFRLLT